MIALEKTAIFIRVHITNFVVEESINTAQTTFFTSQKSEKYILQYIYIDILIYMSVFIIEWHSPFWFKNKSSYPHCRKYILNILLKHAVLISPYHLCRGLILVEITMVIDKIRM